ARRAPAAVRGADVRQGRLRRRDLRRGADPDVVGAPPERRERLLAGALVAAGARELGPPLPPGMKVLVFTSLFPNNVWPHHGVFIRERMTRVAALPDVTLRVVAPVPYYPPLKLGARWLYTQVAREERIAGLPVSHPRYFMIPKIAMGLHGPLMARS